MICPLIIQYVVWFYHQAGRNLNWILKAGVLFFANVPENIKFSVSCVWCWSCMLMQKKYEKRKPSSATFLHISFCISFAMNFYLDCSCLGPRVFVCVFKGSWPCCGMNAVPLFSLHGVTLNKLPCKFIKPRLCPQSSAADAQYSFHYFTSPTSNILHSRVPLHFRLYQLLCIHPLRVVMIWYRHAEYKLLCTE